MQAVQASYSKINEVVEDGHAVVTYAVHAEAMPSRQQFVDDLGDEPCACVRDCCGHWFTYAVEPHTVNNEMRVTLRWSQNI